MINRDMKTYAFYILDGENAYAQSIVNDNSTGTIKMAIYTTTQAIQANALYKNASYVGITHDTNVNDTYIIEREEERLKVLYTQKDGRYTLVFMAGVG